MSNLRLRTTCRLCNSPTEVALELPATPPANELVTREFVESGAKQDEFPLTVMVCSKCWHVQLREVVSPERLFRATPYRSAASPVYREHLRKYAQDVMARFGVPRQVFEIGSNDGTFLKHFQEKGVECLGVDPSSMDADYPVIQKLFTSGLAEKIRATDDVGYDLIVANHVFAHADDLEDIAIGVRELLSDDGVFVFEVGYLGDVLTKKLFDVIYHEHVSYHHVRPLIDFFHRLGMTLFDAQHVDTQGGSVRCFVKHGVTDEKPMMLEQYAVERFSSTIAVMPHLKGMRGDIDRICTDLGSMLLNLRSQGNRIVGYGAPAKCTTLMYTLGIGSDVLDFIVDDNPVKHGLFTPGKHVEIRAVSALYETKPDHVLVLAWNFAESIMARHPGFRYVVPLPVVKTFYADGRSATYPAVPGLP